LPLLRLKVQPEPRINGSKKLAKPYLNEGLNYLLARSIWCP